MVPPETHTRPKQIRIPDHLWDALEEAVGERQRAAMIVELIRWYLREPGAKMPKRPGPAGVDPAAQPPTVRNEAQKPR